MHLFLGAKWLEPKWLEPKWLRMMMMVMMMMVVVMMMMVMMMMVDGDDDGVGTVVAICLTIRGEEGCARKIKEAL